jgi:hypothetical protein
MYKKHHNIIDGVYMLRMPEYWEDIPFMDDIDAEDEDGELYELFKDVNIYDIEDISGFTNPTDKHNIEETIFIIRGNGQYYLCETQGENYIKFASNISKVNFVEIFDRVGKVFKLHEKTTYNRNESSQQDNSSNEHK